MLLFVILVSVDAIVCFSGVSVDDLLTRVKFPRNGL